MAQVRVSSNAMIISSVISPLERLLPIGTPLVSRAITLNIRPNGTCPLTSCPKALRQLPQINKLCLVDGAKHLCNG
jgi:hypothetical protein